MDYKALKKNRERQSLLLDHPEIGIIFTAIAYEPIPTNLDEEEIEYGLTNDA